MRMTRPAMKRVLVVLVCLVLAMVLGWGGACLSQSQSQSQGVSALKQAEQQGSTLPAATEQDNTSGNDAADPVAMAPSYVSSDAAAAAPQLEAPADAEPAFVLSDEAEYVPG